MSNLMSETPSLRRKESKLDRLRIIVPNHLNQTRTLNKFEVVETVPMLKAKTHLQKITPLTKL